ncbi:hypothetical protein F0344_02435 [Streptomyces finlayi]|uniref:SHOCT domain-containing protein n=1 Tax=Streptomyces finlayi TaxID=67296 RepID=A0A7G7BUL0_9ACTN|nr:hypothetical protein F0344_02435 [Streptomyces finlayi]
MDAAFGPRPVHRGWRIGRRRTETSESTEGIVGGRARQAAGSEGEGGTSHVTDLARLAQLKDKGDLTPEEYEKAKAKLLV